MKRFFLILFLAAIVLPGCDKPGSKTPTAESVSKKIEEVEASLKKTQDLLIKRTAERDAYKTEFLQIIRGKGKAPEEIEQECMKKTSELEQFSWFSKAKTAWGNWKDVTKDVVIFTRQNARLEKSLQELKRIKAKLERIEENQKVYRPGEDPELDNLIAGPEVYSEFEDYNNLSSAEQALIDEEVNKSMTETIVKKVSNISGSELKSIDALSALPDLEKMVNEPEKKFFSGYVTKKIGPYIEVLNRNAQVSISFIVDGDTHVIYADGTSRLLSDIRIGQEIEVEYEQGNEDENAYAHVIMLND